MTVGIALNAAARIPFAIEGVHVAFLLVRATLLAPSFPAAQHDSTVPLAARLNTPGAFV
jgi:hypothetical protein